jgi:hypothetical protein
VSLFRFVPGYETSIYEAGREPIFAALLAFLIERSGYAVR